MTAKSATWKEIALTMLASTLLRDMGQEAEIVFADMIFPFYDEVLLETLSYHYISTSHEINNSWGDNDPKSVKMPLSDVILEGF